MKVVQQISTTDLKLIVSEGYKHPTAHVESAKAELRRRQNKNDKLAARKAKRKEKKRPKAKEPTPKKRRKTGVEWLSEKINSDFLE